MTTPIDNKIGTQSIAEYVETRVFQWPDSPAFHKKFQGRWTTLSYGRYHELSNATAQALKSLGIAPGHCVASISDNRPEWNIIDLGILKCGGTHATLFPTFNDETILRSLGTIRAKIVFVSSPSLLAKLTALKQQLVELDYIFLLTQHRHPHSWFAFLEKTVTGPVMPYKKEDFEQAAGIIFSSGSSSMPLPYRLSIQQFQAYSESMAACYELPEQAKALSFLPLCHGFERAHSYYHQIFGNPVYYITPGELAETLTELKPAFFTAVPLVLNELAAMPALPSQKVLISSSGAPLSSQTINRLAERGMTVLESYGQTENLGITANTLQHKREGTVGKPLPHVQIRISGENEIYVKTSTAGDEVLPSGSKVTHDSYTATGDIGTLTPDGYLKILGRKNDFFKLDNGYFYNPVENEREISRSGLVKHVVISFRTPSSVHALIIPEYGELDPKSWLHTFNEFMQHFNRLRNDSEKVHEYTLVHDEWSQHSGELTHNNKIKRQFILKKYFNHPS